MDVLASWPPMKIASRDEGFAPVGALVKTGPIYEVALAVFPNGPDPLYTFMNVAGQSHNRDAAGHDHFNPIDNTGGKGPKSYRIRFYLLSNPSSAWMLHATDPVKLVDNGVTSLYNVVKETPTSFVLSVNENAAQPTNKYHQFNIYVMEPQLDGEPVRRKVDPIVDNPPK